MQVVIIPENRDSGNAVYIIWEGKPETYQILKNALADALSKWIQNDIDGKTFLEFKKASITIVEVEEIKDNVSFCQRLADEGITSFYIETISIAETPREWKSETPLFTYSPVDS